VHQCRKQSSDLVSEFGDETVAIEKRTTVTELVFDRSCFIVALITDGLFEASPWSQPVLWDRICGGLFLVVPSISAPLTCVWKVQEGQHPLTGQRAVNFRLLAKQ